MGATTVCLTVQQNLSPEPPLRSLWKWGVLMPTQQHWHFDLPTRSYFAYLYHARSIHRPRTIHTEKQKRLG